MSPQTITVRANLIHDIVYGILTAGPITVSGANFNVFLRVTNRTGSSPTYP